LGEARLFKQPGDFTGDVVAFAAGQGFGFAAVGMYGMDSRFLGNDIRVEGGN